MALSPVTQTPSGNPLVAQARGVLSNVLRMGDQPAVRRALPAMLILSVAVLGLAAFVLLRQPSTMTLYPGLAEADKARVMEALTAAGITASVDSMTGEVEVATAEYHKARMELASKGLPSSMPDADTVLGELPMGASKSVEGARLRQAQELELARSITEISAVAIARVHLALPEKTAFLRDSQPPRASVFLQLAPGRALEASQVEAIVNLVSSSIPGMARGDVTVVDQMGRLLSRGSDDPMAMVSDRQLQHRIEMERLYKQRIEALLTPITGPGNLSVQVTVDMDFTQSQITEEKVDPQGRALLSEEETSTENSEPPARGVPGAVSNTPPVQANVAPVGGAAPAATAAPQTATNRSQAATRNYEVSKTVSTTQPQTAKITRISAAILLRAAPTVTAADGTTTQPALPPDLKADLEKLTQNAIGFDIDRGDSIIIAAQPFVEEAQMVEAGTDLTWLPEATKQLVLLAGIAIVALGIVRPLLGRISTTPDAPASQATPMGYAGLPGVEVGEGESLDDVQARLEARRAKLASAALGANVAREDKFAVLRQIAQEDPARIASVLQRMMKDEIDPSAG
ncbi:MAG: flagellar M-ring protein FliF [Rhodobacteraceae bacterium PARR1]|nr:MAG: flagellar M-ring protein FliF [Rhodobacteraceae bacterium PARR1]